MVGLGQLLFQVSFFPARQENTRTFVSDLLTSDEPSEMGELFTWGKNAEGQLARPDLPRMVPVPSKVSFVDNDKDAQGKKFFVTDVACGASHGLAIAYVY